MKTRTPAMVKRAKGGELFVMRVAKTIDIQGVGRVLLERSARARRINITVRPFKGVRVAVPRGVSFTFAEQAAQRKVEWLQRQINRMRKIEEQVTASPKVEIDREKAREVLTNRLSLIARQHGYTYNRVTVRNQKTRWGSCSAQNNISLNIKLTLLPDELRDFIILHELVHTRVKNHGKAFWAELTRAEPRTRELVRQVRQHCLQVM